MTWMLSITGFLVAVAIGIRQANRLIWNARIQERLVPPMGPVRRSTEYYQSRVQENTQSGFQSIFARAMYRAGLPGGSALLFLLTLIFGGMIFFIALYFKLSFFWLLFLGSIGAYIPYFIISWIGARRIRQLETQLADTLDSIIGALQAGMGFRQALEIARSNRRAPIGHVLSEILAQVDYGIPLQEAFRSTAVRLRSKHFNSFAATVAASYEAGGNLSPMLSGLALRIRDGIRLRRRVQTLTSEARLSAIILFLMPYLLAIFIYSQTPDNILFLYYHPLGKKLVEYALILQFVGLVWIVHLLNIEE